MSAGAGHLSPIVLDALAAGLPVDAAAASHVADCASCAQALARVQEQRRALAATPRFEEVFASASAAAVAPRELRPAVRRRAVWAVPALALAASVAFAVLRPPAPPQTRLKGAPQVELQDATGARAASARVGEALSLTVGAAGWPYVLVLALDAQGTVSQLWPAGPSSGAVPPGARVTLGGGFQVTPGSLVVVALFSNEPLAAEGPVKALARVRAQGGDPLMAPLPPMGEGALARFRLEVAGPPP